MGPVLGTLPLGPGLREVARESHRYALLASAPLRANHLLTQFSPGPDDAARGNRSVGEARWSRAGKRNRGSAALVRRQLPAALSSGLSAWWSPDLFAA